MFRTSIMTSQTGACTGGPRCHRLRELLVLPAAEGEFGHEPLPQPLQTQRPATAGLAPVQRIGGEAEEDLTGEGVVAWMPRLQLAQQPGYPGISGQPVEQDLAGGGRILGGGPVGGHAPTVEQDQLPALVFGTPAGKRADRGQLRLNLLRPRLAGGFPDRPGRWP